MIASLFPFRMVLAALVFFTGSPMETSITNSGTGIDPGSILPPEITQVPDSYTFDVSMSLRMDVNGQQSEFIWHFNKDGKHLGMEQPARSGLKVFMIMDFERDLNVILTDLPDGSKTGSAYHGMGDEMNQVTRPMDEDEEGGWYDEEETEEEETEDITITLTGNSKKVAGYQCREYLVKAGMEETRVWAAADFPVKWNEHYSNYFMDFSGDEREGVQMVKGMPLETYGTSTEDGETYTVHTIVTDVKLDRWTLNTRDYRFSE